MGAGASLLSRFAISSAAAQDSSDYKALVCVFLVGAMDHADTLLPFDQPSYDALAAMRPGIFSQYAAEAGGADLSSRARENLIPLTLSNASDYGGRQFALPPQFSALAPAFDRGDAAIVGNVGPLIQPTSRDEFENASVPLPPRLFSHNDQQATWQSLGVEGAQLGWGGLFSDAAFENAPGQNRQFLSVNATNNPLFLAGRNTRPFLFQTNNVALPNIYTNNQLLGFSGDDRNAARTRLETYFANLATQNPDLFDQDMSSFARMSIENAEAFQSAQSSSLPLPTGPGFDFPNTGIGGQFRRIAETISNRRALNTSRQMFYAGMGGFDTHSDQAGTLPELQSQLADAIAVFLNVMEFLGEDENVVTFTASDFGRTVIENGDGTDHGWGGHHFVFGKAVNGGQAYGDIPPIDFADPAYTNQSGRLIPSTSVDQYAATLGRWFGLSSSQLTNALPNLGNFETSALGFL